MGPTSTAQPLHDGARGKPESVTSLLVVDDDDAIRTLLELIGRRRGFTVDTAADGLEALALLRERDYDLAVIDLMMPRLSGYELLDHVAGLPRKPLVVIATAMTDALIGDLDAAIVHTIMRKPFDVEVIAELLGELALQRPSSAPAADTEVPRPPQRPRADTVC